MAAFNNTLYGQANYIPLKLENSIQASLMNYASDYTIGNLPSEAFMDFDDSETTSVASKFQKASKKISKSSESSKKINRKKHNRARNPWTPKEDAKLMELMKKHGQSWAMISAAMEGRTGKQIRDRYLNKLRPNIKCGDWRVEEDELLVKLLNEIGNRWSLIATHLPGRTEGQVKNRYYSCIKKRLESNGTLSQISSKISSENVFSFATTPEVEDAKFDYKCEFDFNMMNGGANFINQQPANQTSDYMVSKGPYFMEEDASSEESTTQGSNSQLQSPFRYAEPAMISYDPSESLFFSQPQFSNSFYLPPIENDSQVDDMLGKVTNYFLDASNASSDVDSYFSDDLRSEKKNSYGFDNIESTGKFTQLSKRKAFLELALAKTLKEIKGL